jgi:GR25 family glycosyltransferase involved in LPS biosynthesis
MECHVINLDRSIDNFYKQRPHLIESGVFPKRFSGIDAKKGEHLEYSEYLTGTCKDSCPNSVIGCGLSHILLSKKLYDQGVQLALILEDDAYPLVPDLNREIKKIIEETPKDWDIIKLHCDFCRTDEKTSIIDASAAAYLINNSGLEKMSKIKLDWHIDLQWNMDPNLHVYKSKKSIFWADEKQSENRTNDYTLFEKIKVNQSGQKTLDHALSFKLFKILGHEVNFWEILLFVLIGVSIYRTFLK